jgi:hypothetical protein
MKLASDRVDRGADGFYRSMPGGEHAMEADARR